MDTDVIIVGAGPVGLMLAGELRLGGADVVVYEKLPAPSGESRGVGFTRRAAETFDQRGLLDRLGDFNWGKQGHFGGIRIDYGLLEESYFGVVGLGQARTEAVVEEWVNELGGTIRRGHEVVDFTETADGVTVVFDGPDGRSEHTARYLVGCDGARSLIRKLADIEFPGWNATRGMYTAELSGANVRQRPIGERVPGGMVLSVNVGEGIDRIVIHDDTLRPHETRREPTFTEIADVWQRMTGESVHHAEVRWMSAFTDTTRQAAEYRRGRVLLAGDAAHIHMPAGAQGLSVGVQDAANLGWKLAATVNGWAPDGLLDTYHSERHPVGRHLLLNTRAQTLLYLSGDEMEPVRVVLRELVGHPDAARHLAGMVSGLTIRYDMGIDGHPLVGRRLGPGREVKLDDRGTVRVGQLLHAGRGVLITTEEAGDAAAAAAGWSDRVDAVGGRWLPSDLPTPEAVLLRPDGYVAWAAPGCGELRDALHRWFGSAR